VQLNFPSIELVTGGRVVLLGSKIDLSNRTLKVEIAPDKNSSLFKPNLLAEIKIEEINQEDVIIMPLEYILQEVDGTEFVYIVQMDSENKYRAQKRIVEVGEAADGEVVITSGLTKGEAVIFKGARNVSNGELVEF